MARIRTVKPEFWSHPIMARQSSDVRLLALALLNMADDEGYFYADPMLVRNFAFPFLEDHREVEAMLSQLEKTGYLEARECEGRGCIGLVKSFTDHQVISHPQESSIKIYFDKGVQVSFHERSSNVPVTFHDDSTGKGKEGKGKEWNNTTDALAPVAIEKPPKSSDELEKMIYTHFLEANDGTFANYPKERNATKAIVRAIRNKKPEDEVVASGQLLEEYKDLVLSNDKFWSSQPYLPSGLSPLIDRVISTIQKRAPPPPGEHWAEKLAREVEERESRGIA